MLGYILRRLLWMVPTLLGILLINFAILRMQGSSLTQQASASQSASGETERDVGHISPAALENFIASFSRTGRNLPALINTRGFYDKADLLDLLTTNQLGPDKKASEAFAAQDVLWLGGPLFLEPLHDVIADDSLSTFHAPAIQAFTYCAYTPILPELVDTVSQERLDQLRLRNSQLKKMRITHENHHQNGFVTNDPQAAEKRRAFLDFYAANREEFTRSAGDKWGALFVQTGFIDFFGKLFTGNLYSETRQSYVFPLIAERWQVTFGLTVMSIIIAWSISIVVGIRSAQRIGTVDDKITTAGLFMLYAMPEFFIGTLLLYHLCANVPWGLNWFPNSGLSSDGNIWFSTPTISPTLPGMPLFRW